MVNILYTVCLDCADCSIPGQLSFSLHVTCISSLWMCQVLWNACSCQFSVHSIRQISSTTVTRRRICSPCLTVINRAVPQQNMAYLCDRGKHGITTKWTIQCLKKQSTTRQTIRRYILKFCRYRNRKLFLTDTQLAKKRALSRLASVYDCVSDDVSSTSSKWDLLSMCFPHQSSIICSYIYI